MADILHAAGFSEEEEGRFAELMKTPEGRQEIARRLIERGNNPAAKALLEKLGGDANQLRRRLDALEARAEEIWNEADDAIARRRREVEEALRRSAADAEELRSQQARWKDIMDEEERERERQRLAELARQQQEEEREREQQRLAELARLQAEAQKQVDAENAEKLRRQIQQCMQCQPVAQRQIDSETVEKLRRHSRCIQGFEWRKVSGGYRCAGGTHYVSDAELRDIA
jgi:DNA repair exonuclease SbcCD ATPase subunit